MAFRGGAGKFCGSFYDVATSGNKPCCCPVHAACKASSTQCLCHMSGEPPPPPLPPLSPASHGHHHEDEAAVKGLSPFLVIVLLVLGCWCFFCRRREDRPDEQHYRQVSRESVPIAKAVPVVPVPATNPDYDAPIAAHYGSTRCDARSEGGTSGAGTAIASGLGGFVAGTIVGDLIGRNTAESHNAQPRPGGGGGWNEGAEGSGYDITGDSTGGYDISGDSGGYDIEGDS